LYEVYASWRQARSSGFLLIKGEVKKEFERGTANLIVSIFLRAYQLSPITIRMPAWKSASDVILNYRALPCGRACFILFLHHEISQTQASICISF